MTFLRAAFARFIIASVAAALASCGAQATTVAPSAGRTPAAIAPEPQMVMISLGDRGFRMSEVHVGLGGQVMFMVVNRGSHPHGVASTIPVTHLTFDYPGGNGAGASASDFTVTVPGGGEIDVSLITTRSGSFPLRVDGVAAGSLVVA